MQPPFTALASILAATTASMAAASEYDSVAEGIVSFARYREKPTLILNFTKGYERFLWRRTRLANCSTAKYQCARGGVFRLVIPRGCPMAKVGAAWSAGGVTTETLFVSPWGLDPHQGWTREIVLGDPDRPNVVYVIKHQTGLYAVTVAPEGVDLHAGLREKDGTKFGWYHYQNRSRTSWRIVTPAIDACFSAKDIPQPKFE